MPDRNADSLARPSLHWQSQLILLLILPLVGVFVLLELIQLWPVSRVPVVALAIGAAFAVLVWMLRAATPAASLAGGLFTVSLYL